MKAKPVKADETAYTSRDPNTRRLQRILKTAPHDLPARFVGMEFVRFVPEGRGFDAPFMWSVYISHDPCHDGGKHVADRNTVIAIHKFNGTFKILGRELPRDYALQVARGEV